MDINAIQREREAVFFILPISTIVFRFGKLTMESGASSVFIRIKAGLSSTSKWSWRVYPRKRRATS